MTLNDLFYEADRWRQKYDRTKCRDCGGTTNVIRSPVKFDAERNVFISDSASKCELCGLGLYASFGIDAGLIVKEDKCTTPTNSGTH